MSFYSILSVLYTVAFLILIFAIAARILLNVLTMTIHSFQFKPFSVILPKTDSKYAKVFTFGRPKTCPVFFPSIINLKRSSIDVPKL